jgi:hypothetical protein
LAFVKGFLKKNKVDDLFRLSVLILVPIDGMILT